MNVNIQIEALLVEHCDVIVGTTDDLQQSLRFQLAALFSCHTHTPPSADTTEATQRTATCADALASRMAHSITNQIPPSVMR